MYGENVFPFLEANLEKLRRRIPVVPLTPGERVCGFICRSDLQGPCRILSIYIHGYCSATIRCVQEIGRVCSRICNIYCDVEPLSGLGPTNVEQVCRRSNLVEGVVVNRIRLPVELRVRSIHSLVDTKFVEVGPIGRVQLSAAVILWIAVMICDPFAAQVIVSTQYSSRYFLWAALIAAVVIRQAFILAQECLGKRNCR